jgi:hypothetical protein
MIVLQQDHHHPLLMMVELLHLHLLLMMLELLHLQLMVVDQLMFHKHLPKILEHPTTTTYVAHVEATVRSMLMIKTPLLNELQ